MNRSPLTGLVVIAALTQPALARADEALEDRLGEMEERLDQVEKKTVLDSLSITGEYRTVLNAFFYEGPTPDAYDKVAPTDPVGRQIEEDVGEVWSHRLRLRFLAEPVRSVRVTARMVLYKHFGDGDAPPFIQDSMTTRIPRDSTARFDQAWVDWFMTEWLALSAGRIAYTEGNPAELRENSTVRRATWGLHMVDGEYDTINLTVSLAKLLEGWYMRLFYASWFNDNDKDPFGATAYLSSGTENLRIYGGNMDMQVPGLGKNFLQVGYYVVPRFRPFVVPIPDPGYVPDDDPTRAPAPLNGGLLFPSKMPASMGAYQNVSALLVLYDLFGTGLDVFGSAAFGFLKPNNRGIRYQVPSDLSDPSSPRMEFPFLFLSSTGDDGSTTFIYTGLRYALPIGETNRPKIGFEFNYGSRYLISFGTPTDQLINKLATRGTAYETYFIMPINDIMFLKLTHLYVKNDYYGGFFGPNPAAFGSTAPEIDQKTHNVGLTLDIAL